MTTNFTVISSTTVNKNYSWDYGLPVAPLIQPGYTTTTYVSGYSPRLQVFFANDSVLPPPAPNTNVFFRWDFGDFYNDDTNIVDVTCLDHCIDHIYIMPGVYTVKLSQIKIQKTYISIEGNNPCIGKFNKLWYWDKLVCNAPDITNRITWDDTSCANNGIFPKTWDTEIECLQKYCKNWNWKELKNNGGNPIKWSQTFPGLEFEKQWQYEPPEPDCEISDFDFNIVTDIEEQEAIKTYLIEVKEIPPVAYLCVLTSPSHGTSPYTIRITPQYCKPGSFPFERIVWDFGDGSPLYTVKRYTIPDTSKFVYTNRYSNDPNDPRNYDAIHTYTRSANSYSMFYPSITAFCSNTNSFDACSVSIGPIEPEFFTKPDGITKATIAQLVKTRNNLNNIVYALNVNNQIGFVRAFNPLDVEATPISVTTPPNPIRNTCSMVWPYFGNPGNGYPPSVPQIICNCLQGVALPPPVPITINPVIIACTITSGSVNILYTINTQFNVDTNLTVQFTHTLSSTSAPYVTSVEIEVSIPYNTTTTSHTYTFSDLNYSDLIPVCNITDIVTIHTPPTRYLYPATFTCLYINPTSTPTPTPTPTPTETGPAPTPTPTPTSTLLPYFV